MNMRKDLSLRPAGQSSRVCLAEGPQSRWIAENGQAVDLPLIVDNINLHAESGECIWCIKARVDLVSGQPELIDMHLTATPCLDTVMLQRFFRWATPVEIVRRTIPVLLSKGIDPYAHDYATDGYPDAADIDRKSTNALSSRIATVSVSKRRSPFCRRGPWQPVQ